MSSSYSTAHLCFCEWCRGYGLPSLHSGLVNDARLIPICTCCSNEYITDDVRGHYGRPIRLYETGIERHWREFGRQNDLHAPTFTTWEIR